MGWHLDPTCTFRCQLNSVFETLCLYQAVMGCCHLSVTGLRLGSTCCRQHYKTYLLGVEQQQRLASRSAGIHAANVPANMGPHQMDNPVKLEAMSTEPAGQHVYNDAQTTDTLPDQQSADHLNLDMLPDPSGANVVMRSLSAPASDFRTAAHGFPDGVLLEGGSSIPSASAEDAERFRSYLDGIPDGELSMDDQGHMSGIQQPMQMSAAWQAQQFPGQSQQQFPEEFQQQSELGGTSSRPMLRQSRSANANMVRIIPLLRQITAVNSMQLLRASIIERQPVTQLPVLCSASDGIMQLLSARPLLERHLTGAGHVCLEGS